MAYNPITNPLNVAINEISTGGASIKNYLSTGGPVIGDQVPVATGPSKITGWYIFNLNPSDVARISFYDAPTAPATGDIGATFKFAVVIPAGGASGSAANVSIPAGIQFTTGISFNIGNSINNAGTTGVPSGTVNVNVFYK